MWAPAAEAFDLLLPRGCATCAVPGPLLCARCRRALAAEVFPAGPREVTLDPRPPGLPRCFSSGVYAGRLAGAIRAHKDGGRRDLVDVLGALAAPAVSAALGTLGPVAAADVLIVPVPSSRAARRRRGDSPLVSVARRASSTVPVHEAVELVRRVADQRGLTTAARAGNLDHAMRVRHGSVPVLRRYVGGVRGVVIFDDVVTTGATLTEMARALRSAGVGRVVAATIAATPRRHPPLSSGPGVV